jgi:hypothetical protein
VRPAWQVNVEWLLVDAPADSDDAPETRNEIQFEFVRPEDVGQNLENLPKVDEYPEPSANQRTEKRTNDRALGSLSTLPNMSRMGFWRGTARAGSAQNLQHSRGEGILALLH